MQGRLDEALLTLQQIMRGSELLSRGALLLGSRSVPKVSRSPLFVSGAWACRACTKNIAERTPSGVRPTTHVSAALERSFLPPLGAARVGRGRTRTPHTRKRSTKTTHALPARAGDGGSGACSQRQDGVLQRARAGALPAEPSSSHHESAPRLDTEQLGLQLGTGLHHGHAPWSCGGAPSGYARLGSAAQCCRPIGHRLQPGGPGGQRTRLPARAAVPRHGGARAPQLPVRLAQNIRGERWGRGVHSHRRRCHQRAAARRRAASQADDTP